MPDRSSRREVRNPVLGLPGAQKLLALLDQYPDVKAAMRALFKDLKAQCREKESVSYAKRKGPMTSYWMANGTYAGHIANVLRPTTVRGNIDRIAA